MKPIRRPRRRRLTRRDHFTAMVSDTDENDDDDQENPVSWRGEQQQQSPTDPLPAHTTASFCAGPSWQPSPSRQSQSSSCCSSPLKDKKSKAHASSASSPSSPSMWCVDSSFPAAATKTSPCATTTTTTPTTSYSSSSSSLPSPSPRTDPVWSTRQTTNSPPSRVHATSARPQQQQRRRSSSNTAPQVPNWLLGVVPSSGRLFRWERWYQYHDALTQLRHQRLVHQRQVQQQQQQQQQQDYDSSLRHPSPSLFVDPPLLEPSPSSVPPQNNSYGPHQHDQDTTTSSMTMLYSEEDSPTQLWKARKKGTVRVMSPKHDKSRKQEFCWEEKKLDTVGDDEDEEDEDDQEYRFNDQQGAFPTLDVSLVDDPPEITTTNTTITTTKEKVEDHQTTAERDTPTKSVPEEWSSSRVVVPMAVATLLRLGWMAAAEAAQPPPDISTSWMKEDPKSGPTSPDTTNTTTCSSASFTPARSPRGSPNKKNKDQSAVTATNARMSPPMIDLVLLPEACFNTLFVDNIKDTEWFTWNNFEHDMMPQSVDMVALSQVPGHIVQALLDISRQSLSDSLVTRQQEQDGARDSNNVKMPSQTECSFLHTCSNIEFRGAPGHEHRDTAFEIARINGRPYDPNQEYTILLPKQCCSRDSSTGCSKNHELYYPPLVQWLQRNRDPHPLLYPADFGQTEPFQPSMECIDAVSSHWLLAQAVAPIVPFLPGSCLDLRVHSLDGWLTRTQIQQLVPRPPIHCGFTPMPRSVPRGAPANIVDTENSTMRFQLTDQILSLLFSRRQNDTEGVDADMVIVTPVDVMLVDPIVQDCLGHFFQSPTSINTSTEDYRTMHPSTLNDMGMAEKEMMDLILRDCLDDFVGVDDHGDLVDQWVNEFLAISIPPATSADEYSASESGSICNHSTGCRHHCHNESTLNDRNVNPEDSFLSSEMSYSIGGERDDEMRELHARLMHRLTRTKT